jgi:iron complex transport system substrate-binding protein
MRVVSLLPSATEMLYALGVEPVGVSHECDYPPAAQELPTVIHSRVDPDASSEEINEQVATAQEEGGVYEIDRDLLADLDPNIVVSQGICDVCAVDDSAIRQAVADRSLDADVVTTDPHSLEDVFADLERLGEALNREAEAQETVSVLRERVDAITAATPDAASERPDVVVCDWLAPVMVAGHWIPEMIDRVGGAYGLADPGERSRPREWAEIREYDPDVLVAAPCGFGVDQTLDTLEDLTDREGWADLTAVRNDRVYVVDGHHYVNRPGPRLVDTLEHLAAVVHPETGDPPDSAVLPLDEVDRDPSTAAADGGNQQR